VLFFSLAQILKTDQTIINKNETLALNDREPKVLSDNTVTTSEKESELSNEERIAALRTTLPKPEMISPRDQILAQMSLPDIQVLLKEMNFNELFELADSQNLHQEPRKFVEFHDHNRILIEGQNISSNNLIYDRVTRLTSDYAHSLIHNENYTKAKPEIEKALKLFNEHPEYKDQDLLEIKYYETLIFDRAVVNHYTKNYKEAIVDLTLLSNKFPDDEKFKNWLKSAKLYKLVKLETYLYITVGVTSLLGILLDGIHPILDKILMIGMASSLLGIGAIEFLKWNKKDPYNIA